MMKNIENKKITLTAFSMENYIQHQMKNDFEHYASMNSVKTGYKNLDAITTLYPGLYVLGAISSLGKTTFALQMADQIAETGQDVIIFSLEQSTFE